MILASLIVLVMGAAWLWTERLDRKAQHRELWPQARSWHVVEVPFDYEKEPNL